MNFQAQTERVDPNGHRQLGEGRPEPPVVHHGLQEVHAGQRWQAHHQGRGGEDGGDQPDIPPVQHRQQAAGVDEGGEAVGGGGGGDGGGERSSENPADWKNQDQSKD